MLDTEFFGDVGMETHALGDVRRLSGRHLVDCWANWKRWIFRDRRQCKT
jgi:hypothetical protein